MRHHHHHTRRERTLAALEAHQRDLEEELADTVDAIRRARDGEPVAPPRRRRRRRARVA